MIKGQINFLTSLKGFKQTNDGDDRYLRKLQHKTESWFGTDRPGSKTINHAAYRSHIGTYNKVIYEKVYKIYYEIEN